MSSSSGCQPTSTLLLSSSDHHSQTSFSSGIQDTGSPWFKYSVRDSGNVLNVEYNLLQCSVQPSTLFWSSVRPLNHLPNNHSISAKAWTTFRALPALHVLPNIWQKAFELCGTFARSFPSCRIFCIFCTNPQRQSQMTTSRKFRSTFFFMRALFLPVFCNFPTFKDLNTLALQKPLNDQLIGWNLDILFFQVDTQGSFGYNSLDLCIHVYTKMLVCTVLPFDEQYHCVY